MPQSCSQSHNEGSATIERGLACSHCRSRLCAQGLHRAQQFLSLGQGVLSLRLSPELRAQPHQSCERFVSHSPKVGTGSSKPGREDNSSRQRHVDKPIYNPTHVTAQSGTLRRRSGITTTLTSSFRTQSKEPGCMELSRVKLCKVNDNEFLSSHFPTKTAHGKPCYPHCQPGQD